MRWHQSPAKMVGSHESKVSNPLFSADSVCWHRAAPEDETDIMSIGIGCAWGDQTHSLDREIKEPLLVGVQVADK
jgi:hypothetical protein